MAKKRKILLTLAATDSSGVAFSTLNLIDGLLSKGAQVMVLAGQGGEREFEFQNCKAKVMFSRYFGRPLLGRPAREAVRAFAPDMIHAQSAEVAKRSSKLASDLNLPFAVTANRLDDEEAATLAMIPQAGIVAVSDAIRERLINKGGIGRDRVAVIPNCLNLANFPKPENLSGANERPHLPVVGTFGTLAEKKGQRTFLKAAASVIGKGTDAEFLIMGRGPDKPALRSMADELGITSRITFSPGSTADARNIRNIDLFVEPSHQEGLGLSVLQAMAMGIPVVASGVGGIYTLIEDGETGALVTSGDPDAMAEEIRTLLADPRRRAELARHARERVESDFSSGIIASRMLEFYESRIPQEGNA